MSPRLVVVVVAVVVVIAVVLAAAHLSVGKRVIRSSRSLSLFLSVSYTRRVASECVCVFVGFRACSRV